MILFLATFIILIYLLLKYIYSYWKRNGYPYFEPTMPFGNLFSVVQGKRSFGLSISDLYKKTKEPFIGIYLFFRPSLMICDVDLVHKILVDDFNSFSDRGLFNNTKIDPMLHQLFVAPEDKWRAMRQQLSPTFSSGKLKAMFSTITDVADRLDAYMTSFIQKQNKIEIKDVVTRYTTDVIASVIFGYDIDCINVPENDFSRIGRILILPKGINACRTIAVFVCPK